MGGRKAKQHRRQANQRAASDSTPSPYFLKEFKRDFSEAIRKEDRIHFYTLFIILGLAIAVRLYFLFIPMRYDEAFTFLRYVSKPLSVSLADYSLPNNHLFHTLLVRLAYLLFGNHPWVIRLPALCAGILLVPASYLLARLLYNKYAALLAAGLVATSSFLVDYSTNARGYSLFYLIFLLILVLGTYLAQNQSTAGWLLFAALSALGFYTIPVMLYPFGIVVTWLFLTGVFKEKSPSRRLLLKNLLIYLIVTALLAFVLYIPVLTAYGLKSITSNRFVVPRPWPVFTAKILPIFRSVWDLWNRDVPNIISLILMIGFFASLVFHKRLTNFRIPIILPVVIWPILVLIIQRRVPFERVWSFLLPLYIILASAGISYLLTPVESQIGRYKPFIFAALAITVSVWLGWNVLRSRSVYYSDETGTLRDAEAITFFLKDYVKPRDRVLAICPSDAPLVYYFNLYGVPSGCLSYTGSIQRLLVVVNNSSDQTLKGVLGKVGVKDANLNTEVLRQYEFATLYKVSPK